MNTILGKLRTLFAKGKTLYFPGCTTKAKIPHIAQNYEALLKAAGHDVVTLEMGCCGGFCLDGGYRDDFEQLRQKNMTLFREHQITRIITNDPFCYRVFQEHYEIPVDYTAVVLAQRLSCAKTHAETVRYHDACFLAKYKEAIIEEPRNLLEKKGCILSEFSPCRENAKCCGAGGLLPLNNPALATRIAQRLIKDAKDSTSSKIITASPLCYVHLKTIGCPVVELSEVLD